MAKKKRCGVVGIGNRAHSWLTGICELHSDNAELVALCDLNLDRCHDVNKVYGTSAAVYDDFDKMLAEKTLDLVIVVTPETLHAENIIKSLDAGCEVATEKPLCISGEDAKGILDAEERNGKKIFMAFNYRHIPLCAKVKELILADEIGTPISIDLTWYLDYHGHGASYFRRWHRVMANSGGLLITKASHHFDLANWWMGDVPETVFANCKRNFFGSGNNPYQGTRCRECKNGKKCQWYTDVCVVDRTKELSEELGYQVKGVRDYVRDYCPFSDDVDIYDTMSVQVEYRNGGLLTYSLNAGVPFEGWNLAVNGTKGRLETKITDNKPTPGWQRDFRMVDPNGEIIKTDGYFISSWPENYSVFIIPHDKNAYEVQVPNIAEGHGGGDFKVFDAVFGEGIPKEDPLEIFATAINGALSTGIGAAANQSAKTGKTVQMAEIIGKWAK